MLFANDISKWNNKNVSRKLSSLRMHSFRENLYILKNSIRYILKKICSIGALLSESAKFLENISA